MPEKITTTAAENVAEETENITTEETTDTPVSETKTTNPLDSYIAEEEPAASAENPEEIGEDIDEAVGVDYDPTTQKLLEYKMVTFIEGKKLVQTVRKVIEKTAEEIVLEKAIAKETAIAARINELKFKVAIGKATTTEKADLKLLLG